MRTRARAVIFLALLVAPLAAAGLPTPESVFGFRPGADYKLATYDQSVAYFKKLAAELDMPYQTLINLYLRDCAASGRKLALKWKPARRGRSLTSA